MTLVLSALLAPGPRGLIAAGVFVPLWYFIAVLNAWLGVVSEGYPVRAEIVVFGLVFGVPAVVAVVVGSLYSPEVGGARIWFLWAAGVGLWAAVWLLISLLAGGPDAAGLVVLVFGPLWLVVCVVNLVVGVRSAGYSVAEELPILLANAALPLAVAVVAWRAVARRRPAATAS
ncbi:hypothetical protein AB0C29_36995 [Actinoplanes sp. NPDC048791]|uniref:hypothetical protein n=1 Tax=Actinoplanes sp. NPDC048791 TaxID=3154623 RepID=UPI0033D34DE2